jgi:hypothetical protein
MIYEAILSSSQSDFELFYDLRGEKDIRKIISELNDFYKYDKQTWISKREDAIRQEIENQKEEDQAKKGGPKHRVYPTDEKAIKEKSRHDYVAYVYLVLKVHLEHSIPNQLINVWDKLLIKFNNLNSPHSHVLNSNPTIGHRPLAFWNIWTTNAQWSVPKRIQHRFYWIQRQSK